MTPRPSGTVSSLDCAGTSAHELREDHRAHGDTDQSRRQHTDWISREHRRPERQHARNVLSPARPNGVRVVLLPTKLDEDRRAPAPGNIIGPPRRALKARRAGARRSAGGPGGPAPQPRRRPSTKLVQTTTCSSGPAGVVDARSVAHSYLLLQFSFLRSRCSSTPLVPPRCGAAAAERRAQAASCSSSLPNSPGR